MGYKLTVNKINCEVSVTDREGYKIDYNNYIENEFDITITCDSNYTFVSAPIISYIDEEGYEDTEYFEQISNTKYGLTIYLDSDAIIDAVAKINKTYLHVNTPLYTEVIITDSNGFVINNDSLESGVTYTLTIKPKAGYSINDTQVSYKNINGEDITVNIENEITFTSSSDIIVTTNVLLINRYVWEVYNKLTNATFEPSLIYCDEVTLLSIIANDNYYFNDLPEVNYYDDIGVIKKLKGTRISKNRIDFTIPVMNHNQYVTRRPLFISGVATTDNLVSKKYGIINVYNPTPEELQALSKVRYNQIKNGTSVSIVDLAQYISRLFKLYCNVATDSKAEIKLADVKTKVKADVVSDYEITVDCGIRKISGLNDNILDYTETVLEMFIPSVGHFYVGHIWLGIIKLFLFVSAVGSSYYLYHEVQIPSYIEAVKKAIMNQMFPDDDKLKSGHGGITLEEIAQGLFNITFHPFWIFWAVDIYLFFSKIYYDGYGVPLY